MRTHGTTTMYAAGCRCDDCKEAKNQHGRDYRARRAKLNPLSSVRPAGEWAHHGLCLGSNAWLLTASSRRDRRAQRFPAVANVIAECAQCPVLEQCRGWILSHDEDPCAWHVVAGMTPKQRNNVRRASGLRMRGNRGSGEAA